MNTALDQQHNPTLTDITRRLVELIEVAEENAGELTDDLLSALNLVEAELLEKVDKTLFVRDKLLTVSDLYKFRAQKLADHSKALENRAKRIAEWVKYNMEAAKIAKLSTEHYSMVAIQKNPPSVEIDETVFEQNKGLEHLWRVVWTPDKTAVKEELKKGTELPGARLVTDKTKLVIR